MREIINKAHKISQRRINICLAKSLGNCSEKIIKAHSISNSSALKKIADNGHVSCLRKKFARIGRKKASVFTGFCENHDNFLFEEIDKCFTIQRIKKLTPKQCLLFHFRALARELWAKKNGSQMSENYTQSEIPILTNDIFNDMGIKDIERDYKSCINQIETNKYKLIRNNTIICHKIPFVINSYFSPDYDFNGDMINNFKTAKEGEIFPLGLNIFPLENDNSVILFTWLNRHQKKAMKIINQIKKLRGSKREQELSKFFITYIDNIYFNSSFVKDKGDEWRNEIYNFYNKTLDITFGDKAMIHPNKLPNINIF